MGGGWECRGREGRGREGGVGRVWDGGLGVVGGGRV